MSGDTQALEQQLEGFLKAQLDGAQPHIVDLRRIGVGRSRENWVFDLVVDGADDRREPLILRRDPDGGLVDTDRGQEFAVLMALESSSLPAPRARWLDATGEWMGRPSLIMHREPGVCDYQVVNGARPLAERVVLARRFCELLAAVHAVDVEDVGLRHALSDPHEHAATVELDRWEEILRADQLEAYPELDLALLWFRENAPPSSGTVLVHADFKPGNILLEGDQVVALLDWELAHLGDPLEDLGWVTQPLRVREHLIAGQWEASDLIAHYSEITGTRVDPEHLAWWVAFSTFKTAVMQVSGLRAFLDARSDEPFRPNRKVLSTLLDAVGDRSR